ncbi:MAG: phenylalanine--tRNA ligase subunit beta [Patescibacteria group bacterium]|nr:phenylalanine--tRNA ligase subunit beta [Patescibacteria group bacterium]
MNISLKFLQKFVDLPKNLKPQDLALKLTMSTVEVEEVKKIGQDLDKIVVGKVVKLEQHPNADKLKLAWVDISQKTNLKIVCGGSNLKENMLTAVALIGAQVRWHGEGDLVTLEPVKIRGEESQGMICASSEIGLAEMFPMADDHAIMDLTDANLKIGQSLAGALGLDDIILEIDNKSLTNRPDLWGHYGMAREVAALYNLKLKPVELKTPKIKKLENSRIQKLEIKVEDKKLCPRYMGVIVDNIKIASSPSWLQQQLIAIGQRPINNVVDITNYVLQELGQPLHAFDADKLNNKIVVRRAKKGEKITTLDEEERKLDESILVIADEKQPLVIAGIMGGKGSGINDQTTKIIIESANFDGATIRSGSTQLGLRSDSSARFEKSLDPNLAEIGMQRALTLIQQIIPQAEVVSPIVDVANFSKQIKVIDLDLDLLFKRLGQKIKTETVIKILTSLGFKVKNLKNKLSVVVPSWRATKDINIAEDLIEEITRIYGYDNLQPVMPSIEINYQSDDKKMERQLKDILTQGFNFNEIYNYSFVSQNLIQKTKLNLDEHLKLINYLSEDQQFLRTSLIPNLLKNVQQNLRFYDAMRIFELGRVFQKQTGEWPIDNSNQQFLNYQPKMLTGLILESESFYKTKEVVENLLSKLNYDYQLKISQSDLPVYLNPKMSLDILVNNQLVGYISEIHPQILNNFNIQPAVGVFEINFSELEKIKSQQVKYQKMPQYPAIIYDISMLVSQDILWQEIEEAILKTNPLIRKVELFDIYQNKGVEENKKSLAFHVVYRSDKETLTSQQVDKIHQQVVDILKNRFKVEIRDK